MIASARHARERARHHTALAQLHALRAAAARRAAERAVQRAHERLGQTRPDPDH